jgi:HEAT repeat protein
VTTLRDLEEPESLQALVKALTTDEHGPVRHRAAEALAAINDPRAIDPLLARLEIEDDDYWGALAWAVAQLRDSRCLAVFVPLLSDLSTPAERRRTAAYGLGLLGGPVATASLVAAVRQDPDVDVRKEAIWALIEGMAEDAIPSLREAAERGDESERHLALWAVDCLSRDSLEDGGVQIRRMW